MHRNPDHFKICMCEINRSHTALESARYNFIYQIYNKWNLDVFRRNVLHLQPSVHQSLFQLLQQTLISGNQTPAENTESTQAGGFYSCVAFGLSLTQTYSSPAAHSLRFPPPSAVLKNPPAQTLITVLLRERENEVLSLWPLSCVCGIFFSRDDRSLFSALISCFCKDTFSSSTFFICSLRACCIKDNSRCHFQRI